MCRILHQKQPQVRGTIVNKIALVFAALAFVAVSARGQGKVPMICTNEGGRIDCHPATAEELHRLEKSKPQIPNTPLTTGQKALLDGTAPNPEPVNPNVANGKTVHTAVPLPDGAIIGDTQGVREHQAEQNLESEELARHNDSELERRREQPAAEQRSIQQQNYQAGYAVGQGIGNVIGVVALRHKITKWCEAHPGHDHGFRLADGRNIYCDEWNSGNHAPSSSDSAASAEQVKIQHAHTLALQNMEGLRKDLNFAKTWSTPVGFEDSWRTERDVYCTGNSGAKYTDLDGAEQTCR